MATQNDARVVDVIDWGAAAEVLVDGESAASRHSREPDLFKHPPERSDSL